MEEAIVALDKVQLCVCECIVKALDRPEKKQCILQNYFGLGCKIAPWFAAEKDWRKELLHVSVKDQIYYNIASCA